MEHLKVVCTSLVFGAVALVVVPVAHGQVSVVTQDSPSRSEIQRTLVRIGAERAAIGVSIRDVEEDDPSSEVSDQGTAPRRVMRVRGGLRVRRETALGFVCLSHPQAPFKQVHPQSSCCPCASAPSPLPCRVPCR